MNFHKRYKLVKGLPTYPQDWEVGWCGSRQKFYPYKVRVHDWEDKTKPDIYKDYDHQGFTVEQVKDLNWFSPIGKSVDFVPAFPSRKELEDYMYLLPETRLVDDVDECRCISQMLNSNIFQDRLYSFYKEEYEAFHKIKNGKK